MRLLMQLPPRLRKSRLDKNQAKTLRGHSGPNVPHILLLCNHRTNHGRHVFRLHARVLFQDGNQSVVYVLGHLPTIPADVEICPCLDQFTQLGPMLHHAMLNIYFLVRDSRERCLKLGQCALLGHLLEFLLVQKIFIRSTASEKQPRLPDSCPGVCTDRGATRLQEATEGSYTRAWANHDHVGGSYVSGRVERPSLLQEHRQLSMRLARLEINLRPSHTVQPIRSHPLARVSSLRFVVHHRKSYMGMIRELLWSAREGVVAWVQWRQGIKQHLERGVARRELLEEVQQGGLTVFDLFVVRRLPSSGGQMQK
mmetsp:Transcript_12453/g.23640  ORF Transcript_12453/g.23640 Transcript_12453/m.23640 type:complete len:311 (+) Transcript_12453:240-1172(+)